MVNVLHTDRALARIRKAAATTSRLDFANRAGLAESTIRGIGDDGWNPSLETLKACERAAADITKDGRRKTASPYRKTPMRAKRQGRAGSPPACGDSGAVGGGSATAAGRSS